MNEPLDSKFFSQRAKQISSFNKPTSPVIVKPEVHFQFSNRTYLPKTDAEITPIGRGNHGNSIPNDYRPNMSMSRGRTTVPLSSFVLQKDNLPTSSMTNTMASPIFVMHDEVQFVRPYFGPRNNNNNKDMQSASISRKREILLSALKEIESGLKTL
jgi:hypothetical protein